METKSTFDISSIASKITSGLKRAQTEIEEMALQFALGKADATDKFEEIKTEFNARVNEWKQSNSGFMAALEEFQLQLALGRANAKDAFIEQRKRILAALEHLEKEMRKDTKMNQFINEFRTEAEKMKLKLEILKLKFELKTIEVKEGYKEEMKDAQVEIDKLLFKIEQKWDKAKSKYSDFSDEIDIAFKHIKKAVRKL